MDTLRNYRGDQREGCLVVVGGGSSIHVFGQVLRRSRSGCHKSRMTYAAVPSVASTNNFP
jgi:hypothetical protein